MKAKKKKKWGWWKGSWKTRRKKMTKEEKLKADMKRSKRFHENMCDEDGKEKLRFGTKRAGISNRSKNNSGFPAKTKNKRK